MLFRAPARLAVARRAGTLGPAAVLVVRAADLVEVRPRGLVGFFREAAAFEVPLALRLAMVVSFRNLDSLAISAVLSDAYRKSAVAPQGACRPKSRAAGSRHPTAGRRSIASPRGRVIE
jgi:hypothetical protein